MVKIALALLAAVSVMAAMGAAAGQPAPDSGYPPSFVDFTKGSDISAKVLTPKGILLEPDPPIVRGNLIDYRYDFVPETVSVSLDI